MAASPSTASELTLPPLDLPLRSLVGDYGFDPLGLGSDPEILKYFVQAELIHGRWAMAAVAGILIPGVRPPLDIRPRPYLQAAAFRCNGLSA